MPDTPRLVLLPGLGADHRMFEPQRREFPDLHVPPWIRPEPEESLGHYAGRLAEQVDRSGPLVLGGASLGGMVAWEMARHLKPAALVLIGSCRSCTAVRSPAAGFRDAIRWLPPAMIDLTKPLAKLAVEYFGDLTPDLKHLLVECYRDADPHFLKWGAWAILNWDACSEPATRIFQIHGSDDQVLRACRAGDAEIIPGGGHLISLTHAEQVNAVLRRAMQVAAEDYQ